LDAGAPGVLRFFEYNSINYWIQSRLLQAVAIRQISPPSLPQMQPRSQG
jgi:hypothetical protein